MIIIHLAGDIDPDTAPRIRSGLADKLWEHGVMVDRIDMDPSVISSTSE
jgi:hypothetical protein